MQIFDKQQTARATPYPALLEGLRQMFISGVEAPLRHHHTMQRAGEADATLLLMPAWMPSSMDGKGVGGVKIVNVHPGNSARGLAAVSASYLLFDEITGEHLALLDGATLTARRTAAASALAAQYLARKDATKLLVIGAGAVGEQLVHAYRAALSISEITLWSRTEKSSQELMRKLSGLGCRICVSTNLQQSIEMADIITSATLSQAPLIKGEWLHAGQHVDLIGSFTPHMREADDEVMRRGRVFVDTMAAKVETGDICVPMQNGVLNELDICGTLYDLCSKRAGRGADDEITVFKSVGSAIEDLAAAKIAMENA
jgi:ornithine cyclodeaminase